MNQVKLIDTLYDAAIDPAALDAFVEGLSRLTDSAIGGIYSGDEAEHNAFISSYGLTSEEVNHERAGTELQQFQAEFRRHLPTSPGPGTIAYTEDTFPGKHPRSINFYEKYLQPHGLGQANYLFIERDTPYRISANFIRECSKGNFEPEQKDLFKRVMPHLQRTFRLKRQTNNQLLHQSQAWEMLQVIPYGVIVFNNRGKVLYVNQAAEAMTRARDGLSLSNSALSAHVGAENKRLQHMLKSVVGSTVDPLVPMSGGDMLVSRPSGKRAYSVMINPISPCATVSDQFPAAIVILQDHEQALEAPVERMRALYDLTPAESRVANQMMLGRSLDECAENLGHSVSTSRNLLKRVFAKTDTRRQNDLVSLMLRSPLHLLRRSA